MALTWSPALERPDLLAPAVLEALTADPRLAAVEVTAIDPELADTAALVEATDVTAGQSANCVVVAGRRGGETRYAACLVMSTGRADVNGAVRRRLDARKASFAPLAEVEAATGMAYGGITPLGLPDGWPLLVAPVVAEHPAIVIGSGVRHSKLRLPGPLLLEAVAAAEVLPDLMG
ncbi:YbaK/EbsC family protein [Spongisporangium articulatum]|uniref:YbaK/EbsC family protein n=1 Tax=Spongisporangium articulatum TaxID=3362603 RepID=A0ABW8AKK2_9ACTN